MKKKAVKKVQTFKFGSYKLDKIGSTHHLVPTEATEIVVKEADKDALAIAIRNDIPALLVGETGTGKSSIIKRLAYLRQQPYVRINMNGYTTPDELVGRVGVKDGKTFFEDGMIVNAMKLGAILVLDEVNGTTQDCLFVLHGLLDQDKQITLPDGTVVRPHKDFRVFATCNPDYEGTKTMNKAFVDRFGIILSMDVLEPKKEAKLISERHELDLKIAEDLVTIATLARKDYKENKISTYISTRSLLTIANLIQQGLSHTQAYNLSVVKKTTNLDEQKILQDFHLAVFKQADGTDISGKESTPFVTTVGEFNTLKKKITELESSLNEQVSINNNLNLSLSTVKTDLEKAQQENKELIPIKEAMAKASKMLSLETKPSPETPAQENTVSLRANGTITDVTANLVHIKDPEELVF